MLAQVAVSKYADHLPLYRQEGMFQRHGVTLSRQTMCGCMARCAQLVSPLFDLMKKRVLESKVLQTDDTPVGVLAPELARTRRGRIRTNGGGADQLHRHLQTAPHRSVGLPARHLRPQQHSSRQPTRRVASRPVEGGSGRGPLTPAALFELVPAPARAGIIPPDLRLSPAKRRCHVPRVWLWDETGLPISPTRFIAVETRPPADILPPHSESACSGVGVSPGPPPCPSPALPQSRPRQ